MADDRDGATGRRITVVPRGEVRCVFRGWICGVDFDDRVACGDERPTGRRVAVGLVFSDDGRFV